MIAMDVSFPCSFWCMLAQRWEPRGRASKLYLYFNLLPKRCASESGFISRAKELILSACIDANTSPYTWDVMTYHEKDGVTYDFDFCGRVIRQAVVIQVWERGDVTSS